MNVKSIKRGLGFVGTVIGGVALVVGFVSAATTISTDVTTAGSMYASTTVQTAAFTNYGVSTLTGVTNQTGAAYASSTLQVSGTQTNYGALSVTGSSTIASLVSSDPSFGITAYATSTQTTICIVPSALGATSTFAGTLYFTYGTCN
ncbi:hypothetical protein HY968_02910 [Candidatus Kaiserbacteria bacterium]|nr:hypothetical protein [Candidatus Kaiserbacteria bacterium]